MLRVAAAVGGRAAAAAPRRQGSRLAKVLDDPETAKAAFAKLATIGRNYKGYILKFGAGGAGLGTLFAAAHMVDVSKKRELLAKELVAYPVAGAIGGTVFGVTWPIWVVLAPVGYAIGPDNMRAIANVLLMARCCRTSDTLLSVNPYPRLFAPWRVGQAGCPPST